MPILPTRESNGRLGRTQSGFYSAGQPRARFQQSRKSKQLKRLHQSRAVPEPLVYRYILYTFGCQCTTAATGTGARFLTRTREFLPLLSYFALLAGGNISGPASTNPPFC